MKLFLSSIAIDENQLSYFIKLVGKKLTDISFALIENAADPYSDDKKGFVYETRGNFKKLGIRLEVVDLNNYKDKDKDNKLYTKLKDMDVIWCGGGNSYYLRWIFEKVGFGPVIKKLLSEGKVYGGGSAGAIIAGPSLKNYNIVDDLKLAPEVFYDGLNLTNKVIIPHWGEEKFQLKLDMMKENFKGSIYELITLTDKQTLLIDNGKEQIIPT